MKQRESIEHPKSGCRAQSQSGPQQTPKKTMIIKVKVDDKTYARMTEGKRVEGTIGYNEFTKEHDFNAFKRKSREPGYERPKDESLYETSSGWLKASIKKFKIFVSVNRSMGRGTIEIRIWKN